MNDTYIITAYSLIEDILHAYGHEDDVRSSVSGAEILIVAVVVAKYFQNHRTGPLHFN